MREGGCKVKVVALPEEVTGEECGTLPESRDGWSLSSSKTSIKGRRLHAWRRPAEEEPVIIGGGLF